MPICRIVTCCTALTFFSFDLGEYSSRLGVSPRLRVAPTIDFSIDDGIGQIPIEQRSNDEVTTMTGRTADGRIETVRIVSEGSSVANYAFDVTPARLVTGLITERGVLQPDRGALVRAFPERAGRR